MRKRQCPKIQLCPRCGRARGLHPLGYYECSVPEAVLQAIRDFRDAAGVRWKSQLIALWYSGKESRELRQARNMIGPSRLYKIQL